MKEEEVIVFLKLSILYNLSLTLQTPDNAAQLPYCPWPNYLKVLN